MSDWFNWSNFFYLAGIMIAGGANFYWIKIQEASQ